MRFPFPLKWLSSIDTKQVDDNPNETGNSIFFDTFEAEPRVLYTSMRLIVLVVT